MDAPYVLDHRVRIRSLEEKTTYYFDVESRDFRGNVVRDNNGGRHYTFTTGKVMGTDVLVMVLNSNLSGMEIAHLEFLHNALR